MTRLRYILLLVLLLPFPLLAQTGSLTGVALDSVGNVVAGATISACNVGAVGIPCSPVVASTTSNGQGAFSMVVPVGTYTVTVFRLGVVATSSTVVVAPSNITVANTVTYTGNVTIGPGNLTVSGTATTKNLNGMRIASQFAGADIFAQANAAFTDCTNACTVYIPAGTYNTVTTTLSLPVVGNGTAGLWIDPGAVINYTGTGDAILASGTGNPNVNLTISGGGRIIGTSSGTHGVHIIGFNKAQFYALRVSGFSTGDGWFNEGVNTVDCYGCDFSNNLNGIHNVGKVVGGSNLSANAVHFFGGQVANNTGWGLLEDGTLTGTVGPNNNNTYHMVFESNGSSANPNTSGNIFIQRCDICVISGSYLENLAATGAKTNQILLGDTTTNCGGANLCVNKSVVIRDNIFASAGPITNSINCVNCTRGTIDSNNEDGVVTNFFNNGSLSTNITYGTNIALSATNQQTGTGSYIFNMNNQNGNLALVGNLIAVNHLFPSNNAQGLFQSSNDTIVRSATGGNVFLQDQSGNGMFHCTTTNCFADVTIAAAIAGGKDIGTTALPFGNLWIGTAATNNFKFQPAATAQATTITIADPALASVGLPLKIASSTSTMTAGAITAATCQAAITTAATGAATTDSIEWAYATAPTLTTDALLTIAPYVTANNVNFTRCNPTNASITGTAIVINWRVIR